LLARALVVSRAEPHDIRGVATLARKAGLRVEPTGDHELAVITS